MIRNFSALKNNHFDLAVIGGGIYGAWAAYDACLRGLRVAVLEQGDWGCGTSSASSKLIHGGLRYLEYGHLSLVRKSLRERNLLLGLGPHRVRPLRMICPINENHRVGPWLMKTGLWIYDHLGGVHQKIPRHSFLSLPNVCEDYPFLNPSGLREALSYYDCRVDDSRYVLEIVAGLIEAGSITINYAKVLTLNETNNRVNSLAVKDMLGGDTIELKVSTVVDTTGAWMHTSTLSSPGARYHRVPVRISKGVHLVMPSLGTTSGFLLNSSIDGRFFFMLPWYGRTLLGTTDTDCKEDPGNLSVAEKDIDYLLNSIKPYLTGVTWGREDIQGSFAGLRVMKNSSGVNPWTLSRDWFFKQTRENLFISLGGKLTSARADARVLIDRVTGRFPDKFRSSETHRKPFPWSLRQPPDDYVLRLQKLGIEETQSRSYLERYGRNVERLINILSVAPELKERIVPDLPFCYAEIIFAARFEMAMKLDDVIRRRIPLSVLVPWDKLPVRRVAGLMAGELGWPASTKESEISQVQKRYQRR